MKKILIVLGLLIVLFITSNNNEKVIIPKNAIRFRVIANSNSKKDQSDKKIVVRKLQNEIFNTIQNKDSLEDTRLTLKNNIDKYSKITEKTLKDNDIQEDYKINYGMNYFPEKNYKGVTYKEGEYESLVVTLGEGKGDNFWCVLFPPLCLLDAEEQDSKEIEYKSFVKELLDKYF